ncbi:hypothetical protein J7382_00230 [Shimia sp. R11_0]|uniref:hypothetical protein n=1 Tax=Shimia sp. R11_0 TaxID=2821096 RepID=UPI001ADD0294|nr:hypothetical protein [Shimia sp. R11_0]MBO9475946.1 hypothetical protein [Shimia sp. R11_0]
MTASLTPKVYHQAFLPVEILAEILDFEPKFRAPQKSLILLSRSQAMGLFRRAEKRLFED